VAVPPRAFSLRHFVLIFNAKESPLCDSYRAAHIFLDGRSKMKKTGLESIRKSIENLSLDEKKEFFSDVVPDICDSSLTKEGCWAIFEKKLSGSRYLESFEELHGIQEGARNIG
jgi:hypothetical protein